MAKKAKKKQEEQKKGPSRIVNKKARRDFSIEETFEAGIVLQGTEVKSLRAGHANFTDAFAYMQDGELWLKDMYIKEFDQGSYNNHDTRRDRKLLLNKSELTKLDKQINQQGYTVIPLKLYFKRGKATLELALAKGKRKYDKRADMAEKDAKRDMERKIKQFKL